jgi:hypothetical protein
MGRADDAVGRGLILLKNAQKQGIFGSKRGKNCRL